MTPEKDDSKRVEYDDGFSKAMEAAGWTAKRDMFGFSIEWRHDESGDTTKDSKAFFYWYKYGKAPEGIPF